MDESKNNPQEEDALAPGLEEFMAAAPNPKELKAKTDEDLEEGVQEALDLRERVGKIVSGRSIYPQKNINIDSGAETIKSHVDEYIDMANKKIDELAKHTLKFMGL